MWNPILEPIKNHLKDFPEPNSQKILNLFVHLLYIIDEHKEIMYHNLLEICMLNHDRDSHLSLVSSILDLGNSFGLWEYDQLPVADNALKVRAKYSASQEYLKAAEECMYKLPMIIKPNKVKYHFNNLGSGYIHDHESLLLNGKYHKGDLCKEFLDTVNSIPLTINLDVIKHFKNEIDEDSIIENTKLNNSLNNVFTDPYEVVKQVKENNHKFHLQIYDTVSILNRFYLTHKYDSRGRCYSQGYHYNYQGTSFNKAMLELAEKETVSNIINFFPESVYE